MIIYLFFRIKRTAPSRDALRSFGHALRVRRDDDQVFMSNVPKS
jgi:hypothetical protein